MRSSIFLSLTSLFLAVSAVDLNSIPIPGVTELDTACAAQAVLDTCISSTTAIATSCALTDYACLCQKNSDILTCFNNCPNDPRLAGVRSTQASYCANASAYPSSTTMLPPNTVSSPIPNTSTSSSSMAMTHSSSTASPTSTGSRMNSTTSATPTETAKKSGSIKNYVSKFAILIAVIAVIF
ncbi:hypothetical protein EPUL_001806 [Erysiphe pulchra]|uniref:Extracellular membrane protein CFEM domain-containing protein n=1 Tax=Erysiphe pulchra TaxID=225359 RepID=A0A2S4Q061_9PEZI|nr:hypothetical protein EPUL_001806 [Erysiphe pulchra]